MDEVNLSNLNENDHIGWMRMHHWAGSMQMLSILPFISPNSQAFNIANKTPATNMKKVKLFHEMSVISMTRNIAQKHFNSFLFSNWVIQRNKSKDFYFVMFFVVFYSTAMTSLISPCCKIKKTTMWNILKGDKMLTVLAGCFTCFLRVRLLKRPSLIGRKCLV